MVGVNLASFIIKLNEFNNINNEDIINALKDKEYNNGNELYVLIGEPTLVKANGRSNEDIKKYIANVINTISNSINVKYSDSLKKAFADYFVIMVKNNDLSLSDRVKYFEDFINKYDFDVNTCGWFIVEMAKRYLMNCYLYNIEYINKLKPLVEELKATDSMFAEYRNNI